MRNKTTSKPLSIAVPMTLSIAIYSPAIHGNYLRPSIENAGLDPNNLPVSDPSAMNFGSGGGSDAKAWKDIWGSGQGIGAVKHIGTTADYGCEAEA